ncbi:hypothetical protein [Aliarcobacter cryaerophilus]|nr:hypothetical protein [Aliarcobacter cryaerophilus]MCT7468163.1 hypothetical protein [Aliarcobacter cryaerophilus]
MEISNNNLYSFNIDYFSRAKAQKESQSNEQKVEPDTTYTLMILKIML